MSEKYNNEYFRLAFQIGQGQYLQDSYDDSFFPMFTDTVRTPIEGSFEQAAMRTGFTSQLSSTITRYILRQYLVIRPRKCTIDCAISSRGTTAIFSSVTAVRANTITPTTHSRYTRHNRQNGRIMRSVRFACVCRLAANRSYCLPQRLRGYTPSSMSCSILATSCGLSAL